MFSTARLMDEFKAYDDILKEEKSRGPTNSFQKTYSTSFQGKDNRQPTDNKKQPNQGSAGANQTPNAGS